ncbi:DUF1534 domain-containing protein [Pseudomonas syringae pv. tomato]|nr:DUF1534 domain-containing protein [Pseudomonas syringae]PYD05203.1 hypothetical protein DND90_15655 [Pseudomonas syringae pv. maculicola]TES60195.1 DUF1534 domain-containing protein [Pseudomonas syringae pv. tomato]MCF5240471.1 DUF1534 domain-containing protein [Pseudomonas syringae]QBI60324.1 DUF1534 domain-containing protein [Pseudomonas syringae]
MAGMTTRLMRAEWLYDGRWCQCSALACISKHSAPRLLFKAGRRAPRTAFPRGAWERWSAPRA